MKRIVTVLIVGAVALSVALLWGPGEWSEVSSGSDATSAEPVEGLWPEAKAELSESGSTIGDDLSDDEPVTASEPGSSSDTVETARPSVDMLRIEADGSAIVAGRAAPGARIEIVLDDAVIADGQTGDDGSFAIFAQVPELDAPARLALRQSAGSDAAESFIVEPPRPATELAALNEPEGPDTPKSDPPGSDQSAVGAADLEKRGAQVATGESDLPAPRTLDNDENSATEVEPSLSEPFVAATAPDAGDEANAPDASRPNVAIADAVVSEGSQPLQHSGSSTTEASSSAGTVEPASSTEELATGSAPAGQATTPETDVDNSLRSASAQSSQNVTVSDAPEVARAAALDAAPRVLRVDGGNVSVLQGGPNAALSIDTISYDEAGTAVLGGRAEGGSAVRVYVDNTPLDAVSTGPDGQWRLDLPQLEEQVYTLRVDQIGADGRVDARAETPFKPEDPASLDALAGSTEDGVRRVTVQPGFTLWAIAERNYGDGFGYVRVFEANTAKISDPDLIYPGQIFDVPE